MRSTFSTGGGGGGCDVKGRTSKMCLLVLVGIAVVAEGLADLGAMTSPAAALVVPAAASSRSKESSMEPPSAGDAANSLESDVEGEDESSIMAASTGEDDDGSLHQSAIDYKHGDFDDVDLVAPDDGGEGEALLAYTGDLGQNSDSASPSRLSRYFSMSNKKQMMVLGTSFMLLVASLFAAYKLFRRPATAPVRGEATPTPAAPTRQALSNELTPPPRPEEVAVRMTADDGSGEADPDSFSSAQGIGTTKTGTPSPASEAVVDKSQLNESNPDETIVQPAAVYDQSVADAESIIQLQRDSEEEPAVEEKQAQEEPGVQEKSAEEEEPGVQEKSAEEEGSAVQEKQAGEETPIPEGSQVSDFYSRDEQKDADAVVSDSESASSLEPLSDKNIVLPEDRSAGIFRSFRNWLSYINPLNGTGGDED